MSQKAIIFVYADRVEMRQYINTFVETLSKVCPVNDLRGIPGLTEASLQPGIINILDEFYRRFFKSDVWVGVGIFYNRNNAPGHPNYRCYGPTMCPQTISLRALLSLLNLIPDRTKLTVYCDYPALRNFIQTEVATQCKDLGLDDLITSIDSVEEYQNHDWTEENTAAYLDGLNNRKDLQDSKHIILYSSVGYPKITKYGIQVMGTEAGGMKHTVSVVGNLFSTWFKS